MIISCDYELLVTLFLRSFAVPIALKIFTLRIFAKLKIFQQDKMGEK